VGAIITQMVFESMLARPPRRQRLPGRILHLRRLHPGRGHVVPRLRHRRRRRDPQAGARRLLRPDLP
jgi:plasmid stabilization system protein ParE